MTPQDDALEALIRELAMTHCPDCQAPITPATVQVGWNNQARWNHPLGGITWLVCRVRVDRSPQQRFCEHRHRVKGIPPGRLVTSEEDAITVLREA